MTNIDAATLARAQRELAIWVNDFAKHPCSDRKGRSDEAKRKLEEYIAATGKRPDSSVLDRIANALLHEELTDSRPDKMTIEEYPILSDMQFRRRKYGSKRTAYGIKRREIPLIAAISYGTDGVDYGEQKRVLAHRRGENHERRRRYREFTREQPVRTYQEEQKNEQDH